MLDTVSAVRPEAGGTGGRGPGRKRQRADDMNEALALALLETVRQALDEGEADAGRAAAVTTSDPSDCTQHDTHSPPRPSLLSRQHVTSGPHSPQLQASALMPPPQLPPLELASGRRGVSRGAGSRSREASATQFLLPLPQEEASPRPPSGEPMPEMSRALSPGAALLAVASAAAVAGTKLEPGTASDAAETGTPRRASPLFRLGCTPGDAPTDAGAVPGAATASALGDLPPLPLQHLLLPLPPSPEVIVPQPARRGSRTPRATSGTPVAGLQHLHLQQQQQQMQHPLQQPQTGSASLSRGSADTTLGGTGTTQEGAGEGEELEEGEEEEACVPRKKQEKSKVGLPGGPCAHCGITESPQWRRPLTKKVVLCNACGIYFSRHHSLPKRKKVRGASAQVIPASAKPIFIPPQKEVAPSIICDEKLELDDAAGSAAARLQRVHSLLLPAPALSLGAGDAGFALGDQAPLASTAVHIAGATGRALLELSASTRAALSLPLMTALPVVGGINRVVQTYLHPHTAAAHGAASLGGLEASGLGLAGGLCGLGSLGGLGVELGGYGVPGLGALEEAGSHALESGEEDAGGGGMSPPAGLSALPMGLLALGVMPPHSSSLN
ncbi:hypothetical protein HYH02_000915 [Chlamydomonas schloesseri]|uniref:GATA-type domain-containing protein n=1 Tax=Chlamydomonas schloesseri TaxID=2026947 RepID=A0A835WWJ7_9CHLO|nr:hypothetical protein HYH02_000915 [Chlamydomonas schloesseri]|eukprot:KAG2455095.1 hypothetical protein HYH02_000915 [Chlamydomonas schloesseri]